MTPGLARKAGIGLAIGCLAATLLRASPAAALADRDFPLGQSATGAVCEALQDFEDPAIQKRGARAWSIHCRGYTAAFGRLYIFSREGQQSIAKDSAWRSGLAERAKCDSPAPAQIAGLSNVERAVCHSIPGGVSYSVYTQSDGDSAAVAEGFLPLTDLIEAGLKIVTGVSDVPASDLQTQAQSEYAIKPGSQGESLATAVNAAQQTSDWLRNRAHVENQGWLFEDSERDFRSLASSTAVSESDRAYAQLNVALNISNQGRFSEADKWFAEEAVTAAKVHDRQLDALALNYQAIHLLNQRKFADALKTAEKAIAVRNTIDPGVEGQGSEEVVSYRDKGAEVEISPALAEKLNERERAAGFRTVRLTPTERLQIQNVQALYVVGVSRAQLGDEAGGRKALGEVEDQLSNPRWARSGAFLLAETYDALARLDLKNNKPEEAEGQFQSAVNVFQQDKNLVASPAQATLYLGLAECEAKTGQGDRALADFKTGFALFQESHRPLGDARNAAAPYFDLLLERIAKEPANARQYEDEYFGITQIIEGQSTAQTLAQLSARVSKGDERSTTLARELDDTQRQTAIKIAEIKREEDAGADASKDKAQLSSLNQETETLQQQLLEANPHYGQVIEEAATLDKMQKALRPGEIYVKTVLLGDRSYAIAITSAKVVPYLIPVSRADAIAKVKTLRLPFDSDFVTRFDVPAAHDFFVAIFGPVQDDVRHASHLIYEPDGAMVSLPAAVFVTDTASVENFKKLKAQDPRGKLDLNLYENVAWLGRNTDISLSVSATAFLQSRAIKPSHGERAFVAFGDPATKGADPRRYALLVDPNDPLNAPSCEKLRQLWAARGPGALEGISDTIRAVGRSYDAAPGDVVLGQAFTDLAVQERPDLNRYRVVFFGTHAVLPANHPCLPEAVLVTSLGPGKSDGFLDESEILQLKLDADMVVLAACDTGGSGANETDRTGLSASGGQLSGLARDFIYAGARSLLVSQWQVDASATSALMGRLFEANTVSQSDALRRAETALMDAKATSHPYYWAGFSLLGDGARSMPAGAHPAVLRTSSS
ncbi:MAG: CHAT domain-containing protein [Alphaproteobacteria bacterium]|nr:CHAT domain-containing protein [Alphaproteobacteria bacterium]